MSDLRARMFAPVLRGLECLLPVPLYCGALYPVAYARALIHSCIKGTPPPAWPARLPGLRPARVPRLYRLHLYLNRTYEYLPDRLATPKWRNHCRWIGFDSVKRLTDAGRPVILAFVHFGPFVLLRNWLRAAGVPVAMFAGGEARSRAPLKLRKDRWALFPEVALTFYQDELADAIRHLESGRALGIAIDSGSGRQVQVPAGAGWTFQLATGPIRLARRHRAVLVPCAIYNETAWRLAVEFGPPVSEETLAAGDEPAGAALMASLMPILLAHPEEWTPQLGGRFSQVPGPAVGARKIDP